MNPEPPLYPTPPPTSNFPPARAVSHVAVPRPLAIAARAAAVQNGPPGLLQGHFPEGGRGRRDAPAGQPCGWSRVARFHHDHEPRCRPRPCKANRHANRLGPRVLLLAGAMSSGCGPAQRRTLALRGCHLLHDSIDHLCPGLSSRLVILAGFGALQRCCLKLRCGGDGGDDI